MSQFEELYSRLLSDGDFRQRLLEDPSGALTSIGIQPTPELLQAIKSVINSVAEVDQILGQGSPAAGFSTAHIEAAT